VHAFIWVVAWPTKSRWLLSKEETDERDIK
jgi:hypothetical protein